MLKPLPILNRATRPAMTLILALSIAATTSVPAFATTAPNPVKVETLRDAAKVIIESIQSRQQLEQFLVEANVTVEAMAVIEPDLKKRMPDSFKYPKFKVINDQIFVNGKAAAVKIAAYDPLTLKVRKQNWIYNEDKLQDENYESLMRLLEGRGSPTALLTWWIPQAHAQLFPPSTFGGMMTGGILGAFAGIVVGLARGKDKLKTMAAGLLAGGAFGAWRGSVNKNMVPPPPPEAPVPANQ